MSFNEVYINSTASYFPNDPVSNDEMEEYLGLINKNPSKSKRIVLRNNGIKRRFYALDKNGKPTHTNAQMTAMAVRRLFNNDAEQLKSIELLACGTSSPDQMMPSHGVMVHGELPETRAIEVVSPAGVCCAGMHAFKYAFMAIKTGDVHRAVATGSERFSGSLRATVFEDEAQKLKQLEENPYIGFEKEFLRWMLSDGAGAWVLSNHPREENPSLRIDWLDIVSYAHEAESCMYYGAVKKKDGSLTGFRLCDDPETLIKEGYLSLRQDVDVLRKNLPPMTRRACLRACQRHQLTADKVDWFLPHYSSEGFRQPLYDGMLDAGFVIPKEKWFTNLTWKGNTGSASIYIILEELVSSGRAKRGDRVLCFVPESSRFSFALLHLTVV